MRRSRKRTLSLIAVVAILAGLLIAAYVLSQEDESPGQSVPGTSESSGNMTKVTLFMSYIPSVQFAPIYVAVERGYFAEEGIDVSFDNNFDEANGVNRIANNELQFGLVSGEQVLLARANDRPVVYVFEWFHNFPVGVVSLADLNLTKPADLAGHVVGIPAPQGASYIGLRALLAAGGMTEDDLGEMKSIGFTAAASICEGVVEAAAIYIANEPLSIQRDCGAVNIIKVSDYATLVSNGLITNEETIRDKPELVRGMVRAIQRGLADTLADPDAAFAISVPKYVPDLPEDAFATERQVLENSLALWQSDQPLGQTNPAAWEATQAILIEAKLLDKPLDDLTACYDMSFLPEE